MDPPCAAERPNAMMVRSWWTTEAVQTAFDAWLRHASLSRVDQWLLCGLDYCRSLVPYFRAWRNHAATRRLMDGAARCARAKLRRVALRAWWAGTASAHNTAHAVRQHRWAALGASMGCWCRGAGVLCRRCCWGGGSRGVFPEASTLSGSFFLS